MISQRHITYLDTYFILPHLVYICVLELDEISTPGHLIDIGRPLRQGTRRRESQQAPASAKLPSVSPLTMDMLL